jgi:putative ABC transport system substrate-binding protein
MKRRDATLALGALVGLPGAALAQAPGKTHRIAFLGLSSASDYAPFLGAFLQGLRELGYDEGRNLQIDYRWADGHDERLPELARQLAALKPALIVTHATGIRAAQQATTTIPIVMGVSADPVGLGLIQSLSRPGGNTTGVASLMVDLSSKRLELLKEAVPTLKDVAVLSHVAIPGARRGLAETEAAAQKLGVRVRAYWSEADAVAIDAALAALLRERPDALIVQPDPLIGRHGVRIAGFAARHGLPAMGGGRQFAEDGGLMSYGSDFFEGWRLAARYVDRILKGAKPADLPVEQPTQFELVINARTAKALGLSLPQGLLLRADAVIR